MVTVTDGYLHRTLHVWYTGIPFKTKQIRGIGAMYSNRKAKQWLYRHIAKNLIEDSKHLTTANLGPSAKQPDVAKVKALMEETAIKYATKAGDDYIDGIDDLQP